MIKNKRIHDPENKIIMKKRSYSLTGLLLILILISCTRLPDEKFNSSLILTGISSGKGSELVSIMIDSGVINSTPIEGYVLGSTLFDPISGGYGYVNSDSVFKLINPITGELIKSIKLPGYLSQAVIDSEENMLIGMLTTISYEDVLDSAGHIIPGYGAPIYTNYILSVNLNNETLVSQKKIDIGEGVNACGYFYDNDKKEYFLLRSDNKLMSINPSTGDVVRTIDIGKSITNVFYNPNNKTIIGFSYSVEIDSNYVEVYNSQSGLLISRNAIKQRDNYYGCITGYDTETDCYILVNDKNEVQFIEVSTGGIKKSYKLEDPMNDIKFWRK
jgi:hypothetical protein